MVPLNVAWTNFRGLPQSTLEFPRITLLVGRNNVGKTSAYAPLLLLRQTLDATSRNTALLSRGDMFDAGFYRDFIRDHNPDLDLVLNLGIPVSVDHVLQGSGVEVGGIETRFSSPDGRVARLERQRIYDRNGKTLVSRNRDAKTNTFALNSALLPSRGSAGRPPRELTQLRQAMREEQPAGFLFSGVGALLLPRTIRDNQSRWEKVRPWYNAATNLYYLQSEVSDRIVTLLRGISYIGPLRSLPLRTYKMTAEPPSDVGRTGEHAPELLFRRGNDEVRTRVDKWLAELGYGGIEFADLGDEYFQMFLVNGSGLRVNIAHSGIGLSQLLPILVQGSLAGENDTLIAQQPEIHLNPAQQLLATDFLVETAERGARVIIETHSEHVLLRLRRRIAEGQISSDDVALYYVENRGDDSGIRRVNVSDRGMIERSDWPAGFFEEQLDDAYALSVAQMGRPVP